jgi:threonine synthase
MTRTALRCRLCERTQPLTPRSICPTCNGPLDVEYGLERLTLRTNADGSPRSMWRYAELLPHVPADVSTPGLTPLVDAPRLSQALGIHLLLKLEDANPTHSFKDRIAASAIASAQAFGLETLCCSSTGNLGEAVAARCASVGLESVLLCPAGDPPAVATGSYGAKILRVAGTFDDCRVLERRLEGLFPWGFVEGNLHALASEGAKTIAYEIAEQLAWQLPDAVISPAASGTLFAKLAQGFDELNALGAATGARPRLYGAQAGGCPPLATAWADDRPLSKVLPDTEVRSLAIGDPAYGELAVGAARMSGGAIKAVPEEEIAESTSFFAQMTGVHADSAGGVAFGALLELVRRGDIHPGERVVLVVTGTGLKPYRYDLDYSPQEVTSDVDDVLAVLGVR